MCTAVLLFVPTFAMCQQGPTGSAGAVAASKADNSSVKEVFAKLGVDVTAGSSVSTYCNLENTKKLPRESIVVVLREKPCSPKYGSTVEPYLEVLYNAESYLVGADKVHLTPNGKERLGELTDEVIASNLEEWKSTSKVAYGMDLKRAVGALDRTSKDGVAILKSSIFDVSEHTEGTGFRIAYFNSGRKTIKYVTVSLIGYNAVNDPVRGFMSRTPNVTLRGVGPIEPKETASYKKDYMWSTDLVESFKITQVKLEFMDGTSKVLSDVKRLQISPRDFDFLSSGEDED